MAGGKEVNWHEIKCMKWMNWHESIEMNDLTWRNWNAWIETNELTCTNWNEWLDINEMKCMTWNEWIETNDLTWPTWHGRIDMSEMQRMNGNECIEMGRRTPAETETLQPRPWTATLPAKIQVCAPENVFNREFTLSRSLTLPNDLMMMWLTWWCGFHHDNSWLWESFLIRKFPN